MGLGLGRMHWNKEIKADPGEKLKKEDAPDSYNMLDVLMGEPSQCRNVLINGSAVGYHSCRWKQTWI